MTARTEPDSATVVDLNAARARRNGLADDGRCTGCGHWRVLCWCGAHPKT